MAEEEGWETVTRARVRSGGGGGGGRQNRCSYSGVPDEGAHKDCQGGGAKCVALGETESGDGRSNGKDQGERGGEGVGLDVQEVVGEGVRLGVTGKGEELEPEKRNMGDEVEQEVSDEGVGPVFVQTDGTDEGAGQDTPNESGVVSVENAETDHSTSDHTINCSAGSEMEIIVSEKEEDNVSGIFQCSL